MMIVEPLVASAAVITVRRPVRLAMTRSEDMPATNPAGAQVLELEPGADADGHLTGIRARVLVDRGITEDFGVESIAAMLAAGPYRWDAHELSALGMLTNRVTFGAYRAPTAPPAAFALESLLDELASGWGSTHFELRLANVAVEGDRAPRVSLPCVRGPGVSRAPARPSALGAARRASRRRGHRPALAWWPGGYEPAAAACRLDADGRDHRDHGSGRHDRGRDGICDDRRRGVRRRSTRVGSSTPTPRPRPYAGTSGGSKITYTVGRAVERAATEARQSLLEVAAEELEISPEDLEIVDGSVQPARRARQGDADSRAGREDPPFGSPYPPVEGHGRLRRRRRPNPRATSPTCASIPRPAPSPCCAT